MKPPKKKVTIEQLMATMASDATRAPRGQRRVDATVSAAVPGIVRKNIDRAPEPVRKEYADPFRQPSAAHIADKLAEVALWVPGGQAPAAAWQVGRAIQQGDPLKGMLAAPMALLHVPSIGNDVANLSEGQVAQAGINAGERSSLTSRVRRGLAEMIDPSVRADRRALVTDDLTGLGNRRSFESIRPMIDADPNMEWYALDAQRLKAVNSRYGQEGGDALLRRSGDAVHSAVTAIPGARGFHVSGDEFAIAIPKGAAPLVDQHLAQVGLPIHADGRLASAKLVGHVGDTYAAADKGMQAAKGAAKQAEPLTPVLDFLKRVKETGPNLASEGGFAKIGRTRGVKFDAPHPAYGVNSEGARVPVPEMYKHLGLELPPPVTLPKFGGDPSRVTPKALGFKDTPKAVAERLTAARARLNATPVEPWTPQTRGLLDRSGITPDVGITPADAMPTVPRDAPRTDRAAMGHFKGMNSPANVQMIADQMARGRQLGGETFYPSYGAVEAELAGRGMDPKLLLDATSAGSIRSSVPHELSNATLIHWGLKRGMFDAEALKGMTQEQLNTLAAQLRAAAGKEFPASQGLPFMGTHLQTYGNLARGETPAAYKVATYHGQKGSVLNPNKGNTPGMVLDTHESVGQTLGSPFHRLFSDAGGFGSSEYGTQEAIGRQVARGVGLSDRAGQASRWTGGGKLTGLKSPPGDYAQIFEDMTAWNADAQKQAPASLLDQIAKGDRILFPDYGKSARFPR